MSLVFSVRTRRNLLKALTAATASISLSGCFGKHDHDSDGHHGTHSHASCLLRGTNISTVAGEKQVQGLKIGDEVITLRGIQPIKWVACNKIEENFPQSEWPIRVAQFAIDDETPHRDIYLSRGHSIFIDDVLIPVELLVNDTSIHPWNPIEREIIEYYHIEFDAHEVIYAEGMPVESYRGEGRKSFSNDSEFQCLYGSQVQLCKTPYAPIMGYHGGLDEVKALGRTLISKVVEARDPIQRAWDRIAARTLMADPLAPPHGAEASIRSHGAASQSKSLTSE
jgi:Hint domain